MFHRVRKPMQNSFVESFTGRLCDECLNENPFADLYKARQIIEKWRDGLQHQLPAHEPQGTHADRVRNPPKLKSQTQTDFIFKRRKSGWGCIHALVRI